MTGSDGGFTQVSPKTVACPFCGSAHVRPYPSIKTADGKTPHQCLEPRCGKRWAS